MTDVRNAAIAPKKAAKSILEEAKAMAAQIATRSKTTESQAAKSDGSEEVLVKKNQCAKIMLDVSLTPEQKKQELARYLTFTTEGGIEENRKKLSEFEELVDYLQSQRKILNREGISLQDTEAFAELQSVIDEMTQASLQFQDRIQPLIEVLSAVFEIRKQNKIFEVYREIEKDKEWESEAREELDKLEKSLNEEKQRLANLDRERVRLSEEKSFFGLGPVTKKARQRMAEIEGVEKTKIASRVEDLASRITAQAGLIRAGRPSEHPELAEQKRVLRQFLELTRDENRAKQKELIDSALHFVETSDSRLKAVLGTLDRLGNHAEVMNDANSMLRGLHVIIDESLKEAMLLNKQVKDTLATASEEESSIAKMNREEKLRALNEHMTITDQSGIDIANSLGGLTKHAVQIQSYKDTLRNESATTRRLHLEGVSQMGEQLMSVLSAISAAATSESRAVAANNFARMAEQNQVIVSQEVVRNATAIEVEASSINRLVSELEDYGELLQASSEISTRGYDRMRETVGAIRRVSESVHDAIRDLVGERAEADMGTGGDKAKDS